MRSLSPFFISVPFALMLVLVLPDFFPAFRAITRESGFIDKPNGLEYYHDLEHDGNSERIILFDNTRNQASVKIKDADGAIRAHFYLRGRIMRKEESLSFGCRGAGRSDLIFVQTLSDDTLVLSVIDPGLRQEQPVATKPVAHILRSNGTHDFQLQNPVFEDLDNDGVKEFIGGVMAGFPLRPRMLYIYDPARDTLLFTPPMGVWMSIARVADLDGNGSREICATTYSISNYPDSLAGGYDDHAAWIMVFDHRLGFYFDPVPFRGQYIHVQSLPLASGGRNLLVSLVYQTARDHFVPCLVLSDHRGRRLGERLLANGGPDKVYQLFAPNDRPGRVLLVDGHGNVEELGEGLESRGRKKVLDTQFTLVGHEDYDLDGRREYLGLAGNFQRPVIFRDDFSAPVQPDIPVDREAKQFSLKMTRGDSPALFIRQGDRYYLFSYGPNPLRYLKYPFWLGIYLVILLIVTLSQFIQRKLLRQRYDAERRIAGLQLLVLKNQVDPHFTFNAINAISASLLQQRPEEANRNLLNLSKMMRSCVEQGDKLSRSLGEELDFVNNYLSLMQQRMNEGFAYTLELAPDVDLSWQVPKMVIQIHVENAVKHGLKPLLTDGKLVIRVSTDGRVTRVDIEDNGVGRLKAAESGSRGTGKGVSIMEQFFRLFNKYNRQKISYEIVDLYHDDGQPAGTLVRITIPVGLKYSFYEK